MVDSRSYPRQWVDVAAVWYKFGPKIEPKENIPRFNGARLWPPHIRREAAGRSETGSGFGNCIMVRLGAREIVKLNNKARASARKKKRLASREMMAL